MCSAHAFMIKSMKQKFKAEEKNEREENCFEIVCSQFYFYEDFLCACTATLCTTKRRWNHQIDVHIEFSPTSDIDTVCIDNTKGKCIPNQMNRANALTKRTKQNRPIQTHNNLHFNRWPIRSLPTNIRWLQQHNQMHILIHRSLSLAHTQRAHTQTPHNYRRLHCNKVK